MEGTVSYDDVRAAHRWEVPVDYNIAADVCDKHPREKLAMVWERFDGASRELRWGELQDLANRAAHGWRGSASSAATALPSCCRRRRDGGDLLRRRGSSARSCCRCRCSTATTGFAIGSGTPSRRCSSPTPTTPTASTRRGSTKLVLDDDLLAGRRPTTSCVATRRPTIPRSSYYTSGTTGPREGHRPRAPLPPRARGVPLLPRGR